MSLLRLKFLRKCLTNSGSTRHIFYARDVSTQPASGAKSWRWVAFTTKMGSFNQCAHHCGCPLFSSPRSMASTTWTSSRSWSTMPRYERPEMLLYNVGSLQAIYPLVNWYGNRIMECGPFLDAFPSWKFGFSIAMFCFPSVYLKRSSWSSLFPNLGLVCDPKEQKAGDSWFQFLIYINGQVI